MNPISHDQTDVKIIEITKQLLTESGQHYVRDLKLSDSMSRNLKIDSLMRSELFARISKEFSVDIPDKIIAEAETLEDIAIFLGQAPRVSAQLKPQQQIVASHGSRPNLDTSKVKTLIDVLLLYGREAADKPSVYFQHEDGTEEIITYGSLLDSSLRIAYALKELGLKEGETVAIMQPSHPHFFYSFYGTLLAGGVPVPIYPPFRMHLLEAYAKTEAHILKNAGVRILITFEKAEKLSQLLKTFVPSLQHVKTVAELEKYRGSVQPYAATENDFAFIQYTSGSTSEPKGVLLSHANLIANIRAYGKAIQASPQDVAVSWLPLYHDMGLIGMLLGSMYYGTSLVMLTPFSFLNHPEKWLWAIHYHRGTLSAAPNFAYELCVRKIDPATIEGLDLSSWRMAANGAEKIYPKTLEAFTKKFSPYGFKSQAMTPVYGLAESTVGLTIPPLERGYRVDRVDREDFEKNRKATPSQAKNALEFVGCGMPVEGHYVRIVDEAGEIIPERRIGQLQFKGPSVMQGYYNNPKATQAVYHDGWIDSGDLGYIAEDEVFITGRVKDLIIKAGRNIYPAEIEELAATIKGIRQGCVAAFSRGDHERGTEKLIVVAETREEDANKRRELIDQLQGIITETLDISADEVILVKPHTVPKTSSGKLQRSACKKLYEEGKLSASKTPPWLQIIRLGLKGFLHTSFSWLAWLGKLIYTFYIALIFLLTVIPVYLMVLVSGRDTAQYIIRGWSKVIRVLAGVPQSVHGKENLNVDMPVIYTSNHASYIDAVVLIGILPPDTRFIGKKELSEAPFIKTFIKKLNCLVVDRKGLIQGIEDTKSIANILRDNHSILIFPEGTFGYSVGLRPFKLGAFKMAVETNTPVCPIALQGTRFILRNEEYLFSPGKIKVTICKPIHPQGKEWQDVINLRDRVRSEIATHCGEPSLDFIAAETVAPKKTKRS